MSFIDFARANGVDIDISRLYPSENIKRTGTVYKPKSTNGAYYWDGQRGWVFDWSGAATVIWYENPNAKPWTEEEKRAWMDRRRSQQSDQQKRYEKVGLQAEAILKSAKIDHHNYLEYKGFKDEKGLVLGDKLLIPMRNVVTNKVTGYQAIVFDYETHKYDKKMLLGMKARNSVLFIGDRKGEEFWLVEGYATGLSLHQALRSCGLKASVVVCFSASNLVAVADQIKGKRFIFADNDASETGQKAAEITGLPWTMADEQGWDANDLHIKSGLFNVVAKIMELKRKVLTSVSA